MPAEIPLSDATNLANDPTDPPVLPPLTFVPPACGTATVLEEDIGALRVLFFDLIDCMPTLPNGAVAPFPLAPDGPVVASPG